MVCIFANTSKPLLRLFQASQALHLITGQKFFASHKFKVCHYSTNSTLNHIRVHYARLFQAHYFYDH